MDNDNYEPLDFEDEWQSVNHYSAIPVGLSDDEENVDSDSDNDTSQSVKREKRKLSGLQRTIKYQLIACALVIIAMIAIKFVNANTFQTVKTWYYQQLNSQLVIIDVFNYFNGSADEV